MAALAPVLSELNPEGRIEPRVPSRELVWAADRLLSDADNAIDVLSVMLSGIERRALEDGAPELTEIVGDFSAEDALRLLSFVDGALTSLSNMLSQLERIPAIVHHLWLHTGGLDRDAVEWHA